MDNGVGLLLTHQLMNALLREVPGLLLNYGISAAFTSLCDPNLWPFSTYMFKDPDMNIVAQHYYGTLQTVCTALKRKVPSVLTSIIIFAWNCLSLYCPLFRNCALHMLKFTIHHIVCTIHHLTSLYLGPQESLKGYRLKSDEDIKVSVVQWFRQQPLGVFCGENHFVGMRIEWLHHCPWGLFLLAFTSSTATIPE